MDQNKIDENQEMIKPNIDPRTGYVIIANKEKTATLAPPSIIGPAAPIDTEES